MIEWSNDIEGFKQADNVGWCWLLYKGRVVPAWFDYWPDMGGLFRHYPRSQACYMTECIAMVARIDVPEVPVNGQ